MFSGKISGNNFNIFKWDKVYESGLSKICGRQPLKNLKLYDLPEADQTPSSFDWFVHTLSQ